MIPAVSGTAVPAEVNQPAKVRDAARQFEALLVGQMLKSMHDEGGGWLGTGEDQAGGQAMAFAEEFLAQAVVQGGGLGLANPIVAGLGNRE